MALKRNPVKEIQRIKIIAVSIVKPTSLSLGIHRITLAPL
jgi:hypothetical protein